MYLNTTKRRVEAFLKRRGTAFQTEVQFLNREKMQIKHPQVRDILADLLFERKIGVSRERVGKREFIKVWWRGRA